MPLPGGPSGKAGVHYEDKWTAHCALDVLRERASSIRIEPPGIEGEGIEFWLNRDGGKEHHQVKRQKTQGEWTVAALRDAGVLHTFEVRLIDPTSQCVFVSMQSASVFRELTDFARKASSHKDFVASYLQAENRSSAYEVLRKVWPLRDDKAILSMLCRIHVQIVTEEILESLISVEAESHLEGAQIDLSLPVIRVLQRSVHEILYADDLWKRLAEEGIRPAAWRGSALLAAQIADTNQRYIRGRMNTLIVSAAPAPHGAADTINVFILPRI
jgi:hypothetical protein